MFEKYGVCNWSNLTTEYHGSAENIVWATHYTDMVGGKFDKMINHTGDAVGVWVGNNSFDFDVRRRALLKAPSLFFSVWEHPTGYLYSEHTIYYNE